ncbi:HD domain-containing protein [Aquimarina pacifica]|uniref:HD domain-containing protein n=1 Tax=Aquimarina pacifica TaxID=1296415 RepID=UPI0004B2AFA4|nr:hypothetical protein [Aquimarina pacifica]
MLKNIGISLLAGYTQDLEYTASLWKDIARQHSKKKRFYHTLAHLEHLYKNLSKVQNKIIDWDMVLFALFYHDYIYNALKQDNEEQSAKKAVKVLYSLQVTDRRIMHCKDLILATKGHQISENNDINYFTDADLSILGSDWLTYKTYFTNVRKEYKYYPDFMYNKGRIKVLNHFIAMPKIFKTSFFYEHYENNAKNNLRQEIKILSA